MSKSKVAQTTRATKRASTKGKPDPIPDALREAAARQGVRIPKGKSLEDLDAEQLTAIAIAAAEAAEEGTRKPTTERGSEQTPEEWEKAVQRAEKYGPLHVEMVKLAVQFDQRGDGLSKGVAGCLLICDMVARVADTRAEVYALAARSFGSLSELILQGRLDRLHELDKASDAQTAGAAE